VHAFNDSVSAKMKAQMQLCGHSLHKSHAFNDSPPIWLVAGVDIQ
jgi:hypothetical protein